MEMDLVVVSAPKDKVNYTNTKSATQPYPELASNNRKQTAGMRSELSAIWYSPTPSKPFSSVTWNNFCVE